MKSEEGKKHEMRESKKKKLSEKKRERMEERNMTAHAKAMGCDMKGC